MVKDDATPRDMWNTAKKHQRRGGLSLDDVVAPTVLAVTRFGIVCISAISYILAG